MHYLSAQQAAEAWGVSARSVRSYCSQGRIPGAFRTGRAWNIPVDAEKPGRQVPHREEKDGSPLLERLRQERSAGIKGGIYHKVQIDLAFNSNHMEGSRLSHDQTRLIFETATVGFEGDPVRVDDILEASNHFKALDYVLDCALEPVSEAMIKELHRILKEGTSQAALEWFAVGDYKRIPNEVGGMTTALPEEVPVKIKELLSGYEPAKLHSFEQVLDFHVRFERIHPFQDGNGRVGRLLMFKECLANGIVPFIIADEMKAFYYRGLSEWDVERGFLRDTCLSAQDNFKAMLDYFRIPWSE